MNVSNITSKWLFLLFGLLAFSHSGFAQKDKDAKPAKVKPAKNSSAAIIVQLSEMNREEKNTMSHCPLHNKHMSLSDNYRADASDFRQSDEYPFAYQLNYRRYCKVCTKILDKEERGFEEEERLANSGKATFERCPVHNASLVSNPDYDKVDYEKNPSTDAPHARQYLFKNYCKICTKVHKINLKNESE